MTSCSVLATTSVPAHVLTGLDNLLTDPKRFLSGERVALIANHTTVNKNLVHGIDCLNNLPSSLLKLVQLFGPEHGIRGAAQDMELVTDQVDLQSGLPEVSLYGTTFQSLAPADKHLKEIDLIIFDIQDVGSRYYTYAATMALSMQVAARHGIKFMVLDRPNPIGGIQVEGGGLKSGLENFCALYPIPQRHGMTVGELALLYNKAFNINCDLTVVPCTGWGRHQYFDDISIPWVLPSPNMPTLETAIVYPGMCLLEGTNLSEGRGTTRPFELSGAPFMDGVQLIKKLSTIELPGVVFRSTSFTPMFHKWQGEMCGGLQLHITDRQQFLPYKTGLAFLWAANSLYPEQFKWRSDTYEFRNDVPAIDLLTGDPKIRQAINDEASFEDIYKTATNKKLCQQFFSGRQEALLY